ncbi:MAG: nucleoside 2-deoxyribosyltransferase [Candidatus Paceibacterota bacterium]|jgi:nucleoside 2-deoxyribosyltransferase
MKIYITAPFRNGDNKAEIEELCLVVRKSGFEDFCFIRDIENYQKVFNDPHELMQRAKAEIEKCDALLIDYDGPGNGRIIELGIAYALNKQIILIAKKGTKIKDTVAGVADKIIEYEKLEDIIEYLSA